MKIGILMAMSKEFALLLPNLQNPTEVQINGYTVYVGKIANHEVFALQCGIGKVNAAIATTSLIFSLHPDLIISSGVAGGASKTSMVKDIVVADRVAYYDVYCGPETQLGAVMGLPQFYKSAADVIETIKGMPNIKVGLICTGDQFIDTQEQVDRIRGMYPDAQAVDMESGAIAQCCTILNTPFLSIRIISDSPGASKDNLTQYDDFWAEAPKQTFAVVKEILSKI